MWEAEKLGMLTRGADLSRNSTGHTHTNTHTHTHTNTHTQAHSLTQSQPSPTSFSEEDIFGVEEVSLLVGETCEIQLFPLLCLCIHTHLQYTPTHKNTHTHTPTSVF